MNFAADLPVMMSDFGVDAVVGGVAVRGIFDAPYSVALGVAGCEPLLTVPAAAVPAVARGVAVTIGADSYTVIAIEPDLLGGVALRLESV